MSETVGDFVVLDWYDGPLLEAARVDFPHSDPLVQVVSLCTSVVEEAPPTGRLRGTVSGNEPWTRAVIRLSRQDLLIMIDLLDGKPVPDWTDR